MQRDDFVTYINQLFKTHTVVALLGPRQCGKTTLSQMYAERFSQTNVFDLENPRDLQKLESPMLALEELSGLIIVDEIQRRPDLFPVLRVLVDHISKQKKQKYLILGSASRDLIRQSSETLAGRIAYLELTPFTFAETHELNKLWIRGGFPHAYLAKTEEESYEWRKFYITTFLEKDIPALGIQVAPVMLRRFWTMLAHYHANIFNASEIGRSLGISHTAIRNYLDILSGVFMIRVLNPWFENIKKRQVKAPKIYFRDSGILHALLGIKSKNDLLDYPKLGASWEGFALEEIIRHHHADPEDCYYWAVHTGAELDLLIVKDGKRLGFEFKYTDAPKLTKSMHTACEELHLDKLTVIFPGKESFPLAKNVRAIGLESYLVL